MKDLPNPFWATLFMILGCVLLLSVLVKVNVETTTTMLGVLMAVATAGTSIISGAFGYIQGRKDGAADSVQVPLKPLTTTTVSVDPTNSNSKE
jgi:hypothetical protein